jgi:curli biogenesis system outer membrane secretion channel CsgG
VAVWDLENLSLSTSGQPELGEILSGQIIETLKKRGDYAVVERKRLLLALEELRLGTTALADESTRLRLGKLVGARWMVFGAYLVAGSQMRLDLRLVEVETGKVKKAVEKTSSSRDLNDWLAVTRKAAEELL